MNPAETIKNRLLAYIDSLQLLPGDKLPTLRKLERKFKLSHYHVHKLMHEIAADRDYLAIHGSGFFIPGKARAWKPFEKTIAFITPGMLLPNDILAKLHRESIRRGFNFLNLSISHEDPAFEHETLEFLSGRRVWGVMIDPYPDPERINISILKRMRKQGIRCVLLSLPETEKQELSFSLLDFHKAGYLSAAEAMRTQQKQVCFLNFSPRAWHTVNFLEGLRDGCRDFEMELENCLMQTAKTVRFLGEEWIFDRGKFLSKNACAYVCETWHGRAVRLHQMLDEQKACGSTVIGYQDMPDDSLPFPVICFDNQLRLLTTLKKIMTSKCVRLKDIYAPVILRGPCK